MTEMQSDILRKIQANSAQAMVADKSGYVDDTFARPAHSSDSPEPQADRSCVRCAHYRKFEAVDFIPKTIRHLCERPELGSKRDLVVGASIPNTRDAYRERADNVALGLGEADDRCGPEGKFWAQSGF